MDFDAGYLGFAYLYRKRQPLKKREVYVDIEILSLSSDEAIGDSHERLSYLWEVVQAFLNSEIGEIIAAQFCSQESGELLILLQESVLEIRSKNMMSVFDLIQGRMELATQSLCQPNSKNLRNLVDCKFPQSQLAGALEYFVDRKVPTKDENKTRSD